MIVTIEEAIGFFQKLPKEMRSLYYHPEYVINDAIYKEGLEPLFFVREKNGNIFYHAFHLGEVPNTPYYDIQTPYGYGGPIALGDTPFIEESIEAYKEWCNKHSIIVEFIRFHPLLRNERHYYGEVQNNRQTVYIDLTKKDLLSGFNSMARRAIRKAENNKIKITFDKSNEYIRQFISLYYDLMTKKNAEDNYFFCEDYFIKLLSNKNVHLVSGENESGEVIGASIFFEYGQLAEYHLSASSEEGRDKRVSNLMIYEIAKHAQNNRFKSLYLGGGTDPLADNSLLFFKKGFSKNESNYKIGNYKHDKEAYESLKSTFLDQHPQKENFILFYR